MAGATGLAQPGQALTAPKEDRAPLRVLGQDPVERAQQEMQQKLARLAEIESGLTGEQRAIVQRVLDQAPETERWGARRGALSVFAGEADPLLQPTSEDDRRAFIAAQKAATKLRRVAPPAPMARPEDRVQPDMLGGQPVTEEDMAAKERRRKEWGRYLGIAEGAKSSDDMVLEGRDVLIRPGFTVIRAKNGQKSDLDYRIDTQGMGRDEIASAVRGALRELDRRAPLPVADSAPVTMPVGVNARGKPLFEDERGVRSYTDGGVRITESVRLTPTQDNGIATSVNKKDRGRDYLTQEEWDAKNPPAVSSPDGTPFEAVGMVKGKAASEDAWFRKQAEQGGVASYKARSVSGGWKLTRDFLADNNVTSPPTRQLGTVATAADAIAQLRENGMRTGVPEEAAEAMPPLATPKAKAKPVEQPAYGANNKLVTADRAAVARERLKAKLKDQLNSGIDPEILQLGAELAVFHIEAGARRFAEFAKAVAADLGTTPAKLRPYLRSWYNGARDLMEDNNISIDGMDGPDEVRAAVANLDTIFGESPASQQAPKSDTIAHKAKEAGDGNRPERGGDEGNAGSQPETVPPDVGGRRGDGDRAPALRGGEGGVRPDPAGNDGGLEVARGNGRRVGAGGGNGNDVAGNRPRNYRIPPGGLNDTRGEKTRAKDSIEAIRLLKQIEAKGRRATPAEQEKLALYAGAGSLNPAVPNSDGTVRSGWESLASDLQGLVSKDEMETIARTTQYAFYTSEDVVRAMWGAVQRLGFNGGTVFEPGMGIGHFLGMAPEAISGKMTYRGIELDSITARIARQLYPEATVQNQDYTVAQAPRDFYDLAIGNPPFANIPITSDKNYPQKFLLHDYFFAKTLDSVRPGGLLAFITSEGTMNKMDSAARQYLADRADLVGAIRLPNTAFKGNAGTEVTTDVIFLRKRAEGEAPGDQSWVNVDLVPLESLEGGRATEFKVNRYFVQNPGMILGDQGGFGKQRFRGQYAVVPRQGENLAEAFAAAAAKLPANVMTDPAYDPTRPQDEVDPDSGQTKAGSYYIKDGDLWQYDGSVGRKVKRRGGGEGGTMSAADYSKAMQFVAIRDALRATYAADLSGDAPAAEAARKALNDAYDAFVAKHGPINRSRTTYQAAKAPALERHRAMQREAALEEGRVWDEGSFDPTPYIDATMLESPAEDEDNDAPTGPALGAKPQGKKYTWTAIAKMRAEARARLGAAYDDGSFDADAVPDTEIVKRENLNAIMDDPEVWRIAALEKYDAETDTATKTTVFKTSILARQNEPVIKDAKDALNYVMAMRGFVDIDMIAEKAGIAPDAAVIQLTGLIFRNPATGRWENRDTYLSGNVRIKLAQAKALGGPAMHENILALEQVLPRDLTEFDVTATPGMPWIPTDVMRAFARDDLGILVTVERASAGGQWSVNGDSKSAESTVTFGTADVPFPVLFQQILNRVVIKVQRTFKDASGSTKTVLDEAATQAANEKADAIRQRFVDWVWKDEKRKEQLLRIYNDRFNSTVAPTFDGSYLTTPGIAAGWSWRPHQLRAIARILQSGSTYLAHAVGAGKTSEMIASAMEARRLGIARKPMFAVPNHMLGQFAAEFYEHYPTANILVADDRRFHANRRRQFIADAAANDYDAIVLTHSSFQKIPVSDSLNDEFVRTEIERFDEAIRQSRKGGDRMTTKEMERAKERLAQRLRGARDASRADAQLTFEEMGVDMLFVDEAHLFRKLDFATQLGALKGVTPSGSQMAWDLFLKTRHLERVNPGRGIVLASGTPITNTMAELFTLSRYIQYSTLEDQGLLDFDSWAQSYGETSIDYEPDAAGNYKAVSRFSKFVNIRDLSLMVRERMDTVIPEDLEKYVVRPKLKGGKRIAVPVPRSQSVADYQDELAARMKALEKRKGPPKKGDDNHLVIIGDGIAAATDMRLIDERAPSGDSKLDRLAANVLSIHRRTENWTFYKPDAATRSYSTEPAFRGPAAQMVFADIQRRPGKSSFDTHQYIKDYLVRNGVPAEQIALFRDYKNTEAKRRLFRRVNDGEVRVLIGSAKAMGTGVNAQRRLVAMHNLDPHWYPALDEQRVGRILRQGNFNPEIEVYDYATEGTYDSTMWQMMGRKARTIEDFLRGDPNINEMEDVGPASVFEQLAGMTTPDPRILRLKELQEEVKKLQRRRANLAGERRALIQRAANARSSIKYYGDRKRWHEEVMPKHVDLRGKGFKVTIAGEAVTDRKRFGQMIQSKAEAWALEGGFATLTLGEVNGVPILLDQRPENDSGSYVDLPLGRKAILHLPFSPEVDRRFGIYMDPVDTAKALAETINSIPEDVEYYTSREEEAKQSLSQTEAAIAGFKAFADGALLEERQSQLKELLATLDAEEAARRGKAAASETPPEAPASDDGDMEMRDARAPVARLTGDELGPWEDIRQLGRKVEAWYRANLIGTTVVNRSTGMEVQFRREGGRKVSGRKGDVLMRIVPALREIIANGTLTNTEADTRGNPGVKAWHTISASVVLAGKPCDVVVKIKETANGSFHYDLSRDMSDGARQMVASGRGSDTAIGLEDNPVNLNLDFSPDGIKSPAGWGEVEADPPITDDDLRAITQDMNAELTRSGLAGKVPVKVVRRLISHVSGRPILGRFNAGRGDIEVAIGNDTRGVMRHEIVHALRSEKLWNKPFGLFTAPEWRELARAARAEPGIVASVMERYADRGGETQTEEMVAELYRLWAAQRDNYGAVERALLKVEGFLTALANLVRGRGFVSAARALEQIAAGKVGGRGPQGPGGGLQGAQAAQGAEMRAPAGAVRAKFDGLVGFTKWRDPGAWISDFLTDRMVSENASILALVPGRALFAEVGKTLLSAKAYLRTKEEMDALRNDWHAKAAAVADEWIKKQAKDPRANDALMDLMHRSTLTGVDPTKPDTWGVGDNLLKSAKAEVSRLGSRAPDWALQKVEDERKRRTSYATIKALYDALPAEYQGFYSKVKETYERLANDWDAALEENLRNASRIAMKNAERAHRQALRQISDDGLKGAERDEAIAQADEDLRVAKARSHAASEGKIKSLRKIFESQRLKGPYFPLARFGKFFVTVRDADGKVVSFARMESAAQQQAHVKEMQQKHPDGAVSFGVIDLKSSMRDQVDPKFVAEIESIVADSGADPSVLDAIWQRYLETLPDDSIRTAKIHRKGREGFNRDALRAFSHHMFHGAHQLARLKYGMSLQEHVADARDEARRAADPNRMGAVVDEMQRRMEWTLNPQGAGWVAAASSISFMWYLGVSPAAALVNLTQTTIIGPAVMKARFQKVSTGKILSELARATKDFANGRGPSWSDTWSAENSARLTADEKAAMKEGYRRGTIDKTQAYDLPAVADTGIQYNPFREKWMRRFAFAFHHAERVNREVTYLANYRLARADGLGHADAMDAASDMTWKIHFSYQNSDRPRVMQGDWPKFFLQFKQYQINAIYRLFRDAYQSLRGASAAERKEARTQLIGISLSMMAHAGVKGVWGYGLIMAILALFFPGDKDELEDWMQDALLMEGDTPGVAAWNFAMGAALNGVPGQITGTSLTERIGMPDLWFRQPDRDLEGTDLLQHYVNEALGPSVGIMFSLARGAQYASDGEVVRGVEAMVPKAMRDLIKTGRFASQGVETMNGDDIVESLNPWELLMQANGFTPARVAERYDMNNRLKNREKEVIDERKALHRAAGDALAGGKAIPPTVMDKIRDFNTRFPEYPITGETIRQSYQGRQRASQRNEFGVSLNPKLNARLRDELPPLVYN